MQYKRDNTEIYALHDLKASSLSINFYYTRSCLSTCKVSAEQIILHYDAYKSQ